MTLPSETRAAPAKVETVVSQFFAMAKQHPDRVAVIEDTKELTYRGLERRVLSIGAVIAERTQPGAAIGLICHKSMDLPAALLSILATDRTVVPLDPSYPSSRLKIIAETAHCELFLSDVALTSFDGPLRQLFDAKGILIVGEVPTSTILAHPSTPDADRLAYILFTS